MVFEQHDIEVIEDLKDLQDKASLVRLQKIYNKYTGSKKRDCFCSKVRRAIWSKHFNEWYQKNK
jgi:hypothetical protein